MRVVEAAVGETPGTVRFTTGLDTVNHVVDVDGKAGSSTDIMVVRLDDELGDQVPRVMKLDVEGYELPVLRGGAQLLVDTRLEAIVVELNGSGQRYGFHDSDTVALLEGAGFERCVYDPFSRELSPRRVDHRNDNVLFIRAGSDVGARMKSAAPFTVLGRTI
ncbi:methyltransferase, FkbM family domain protein [Candidatus Phaeomarinobacter ectocarpi]|uniref:Methyltransferase, FkbM family domain protein n=1 Tax=Candidatus Phaeomarinibacter ectocarpi TaxID=1458461 RepID=X5ME68_9HYPH|nr:methyltransferase, FkbM family domain protein [Candidatus Phaeomarinobacter ectocarpi]